MIKITLILLGLIILFAQHYLVAMSLEVQFFIFMIGILLLGVPHGAADVLVAQRNADFSEKRFSKRRFFIVYLSRLLLFALILFLFPFAGMILFILFAAYHFGETDLSQFKTDTFLGKLFVASYGLLILNVIILHHFEDVIPILNLFESTKENQPIIEWLGQHRYFLLSANAALFFLATFIYFIKNNQFDTNDKGEFLVRLALIMTILFNLPLLLGFTFYFVVWHSVISLNSIIRYLRKKHTVTYQTIAKQMLMFSLLANLGILLLGFTSSMFINENTMAGYVFLGLAVLTAPHMEVMYNMYTSIRKNTVDEATKHKAT